MHKWYDAQFAISNPQDKNKKTYIKRSKHLKNILVPQIKDRSIFGILSSEDSKRVYSLLTHQVSVVNVTLPMWLLVDESLCTYLTWHDMMYTPSHRLFWQNKGCCSSLLPDWWLGWAQNEWFFGFVFLRGGNISKLSD